MQAGEIFFNSLPTSVVYWYLIIWPICQAWSGSKLFDTDDIPERIFKIYILKKKKQQATKSMQIYPIGKQLISSRHHFLSHLLHRSSNFCLSVRCLYVSQLFPLKCMIAASVEGCKAIIVSILFKHVLWPSYLNLHFIFRNFKAMIL